MSEITNYPPGTFCWVDLATKDPDGAKDFYLGLFGWEAVDMPTDVGIPYTMLMKAGKTVCALYRMSPEQGDHPYWQSYVTVENVDAAAAVAQSEGGTLIMPAMDVMDVGRMATIQDPAGAVLSLWQPAEHQGAELWNEPGACCWNELQTNDMGQAEHFYKGLFSWTTKVSESVMEGKYRIFVLEGHEGQEVGGMLRIEPDWGPVPPNWAVYFCVEDCDGTVEQATRLGGKLLFPAMEIENVGRFAFLEDPQGAGFAVIQAAHPM